MYPTRDTLDVMLRECCGAARDVRLEAPSLGVTMRIIEFSLEHARPIDLFESVSAASVPLGDGSGEAHVYCLYFGAGGMIGKHQAGFGQLFLVVSGSGWAVGGDGRRAALTVGQGVYFERGEVHSKGSERGMTVIMVQVTELEPGPPETAK
jgi:quercetin dioxygenase-like cupin family protein